MEVKVWIGNVQRIICGVVPSTTSQEVIVALAQATGKTGRFTLVEKWRDHERTLAPSECPLLVAQKWGEYAHEVQLILRQTGEVTSSKRLADAKSPMPQRRRNNIKKSLSFSGGAQALDAEAKHVLKGGQNVGTIQEEETVTKTINESRATDEKEAAELLRIIREQEYDLMDQHEQLSVIAGEYATFTAEDEKKIEDLNKCQEEITKTLLQIERLELELDMYDEVLLAEELNVLLRQQEEVKVELSHMEVLLRQYDSDISDRLKLTDSLAAQLTSLETGNRELDIRQEKYEEESRRLELGVKEKKKFLSEAEGGYRSACEELEEAIVALNKRKKMVDDLERELREHNLKEFTNGFVEKPSDTLAKLNPPAHRNKLSVRNPDGLLV